MEAQAKKKKIPRNINMLGYQNYGPAVSGDGNAMVFVSNYTNEGTYAFMSTEKINASKWKDPTELPRIINIPHLTYRHGYCLNFDGSAFYFTFKKSGGLGGYDLWMAERQGEGWGAAKNLGSPLNSSLNDGSPSISSDGKTLYYMACEEMGNETASGCKIMVSTRRSAKSKWGAPTELPAIINQGNAMSPNILADGETLMYLSDHEGSPQWYMSRLEDDNWNEPEAMIFIDYNSARNISIPAKGRYLYHDVQGERGTIIEGLLIPDQFKPKNTLRVIGKVNSAEGGTMKVYNVETRNRVIFQTFAAGEEYDFVLKEGNIYDVSFDTDDPETIADAELFDLTVLKNSTRRKWEVDPVLLEEGDSVEMKAMIMDTTSVDVSDHSIYEFRRLTRFLSKSQIHYEVSIIHYPLDTAKMIEPMVAIDSVDIEEEYLEEVEGDSTNMFTEVDTLSNVGVDSAMMEEPEPVPTMAENLATKLADSLKNKNVPEEKVSVRGITIPIKELDGNENKANKIYVYLKRTYN